MDARLIEGRYEDMIEEFYLWQRRAKRRFWIGVACFAAFGAVIVGIYVRGEDTRSEGSHTAQLTRHLQHNAHQIKTLQSKLKQNQVEAQRAFDQLLAVLKGLGIDTSSVDKTLRFDDPESGSPSTLPSSPGDTGNGGTDSPTLPPTIVPPTEPPPGTPPPTQPPPGTPPPGNPPGNPPQSQPTLGEQVGSQVDQVNNTVVCPTTQALLGICVK